MRKSRILTFIIAFAIINLFAGCSIQESSLNTSPICTPPASEAPVNTKPSAPRLVALEIGSTTDSSDGGIHTSEYEPWNNYSSYGTIDPAAPKSMTITFNGKEYFGEYTHSSPKIYSSTLYHRYCGDHVFFEVCSETNELYGIVDTAIEAGNASYKDCEAIANQFASKYINIAEYEMTALTGDAIYCFIYQKRINGIDTNNTLGITVSTSGKITQFAPRNLDSFSTENTTLAALSQSEEITRITDTDIEPLIAAKVSKIYPDIKIDELEWTEILVELEDGSVGLLCNVSAVTFIPVDDGYHSYSRHVQLLVKEDDSL